MVTVAEPRLVPVRLCWQRQLLRRSKRPTAPERPHPVRRQRQRRRQMKTGGEITIRLQLLQLLLAR
jgi:hypothetical protein